MSQSERSAQRRARDARAAEYYLALRVGLWLLWLPIRLRFYSLPTLLQRLTPTTAPQPYVQRVDTDRAARIVRRMARLRLFRMPLFPHICLRQSLALYWVLRKVEPGCEIHFGIHREGGEMCAHSWVTVDGVPVFEERHPGMLGRLYTYPSVSSNSSPPVAEYLAR